MSARLNNLLQSIKLFIRGGLWNNTGLVGIFIDIIYWIILYVLTKLLEVLKFGLKFFGVLIDEFFFHAQQLAKASSELIGISMQVRLRLKTFVVFKFERLFDSTITYSPSSFSPNWKMSFLKNLAKSLFHFLIGLILVVLSLSSIIYTILSYCNYVRFDFLILISLCVLFGLPILHRFIRYKLTPVSFKFPDLFEVESFPSALPTTRTAKVVYVIIGVLLIILPLFYYSDLPHRLSKIRVFDFISTIFNRKTYKPKVQTLDTAVIDTSQEVIIENKSIEKEESIDYEEYTVVKGEGLSYIAKKYVISIDSLAKLNNIKKECIKYDRVLICKKKVSRRHRHNGNCYKRGRCIEKQYADLKLGTKLKVPKLKELSRSYSDENTKPIMNNH